MARILVVEDDQNLREFFQFVLENSGHRVECVSDGQAALAACAAQPPDLVLLDVMLPEVNGYEVCHRLKTAEATKSVKVLFVTAKTFAADRVEAKNAGADGFLSKPVAPLDLLSTVKGLLPAENHG